MLLGALTTSAWAVISSLLALIVLHQHLLFRKSKLASFYNTARFVMKYCSSNIKYCNHFNKLSVQFRLKYLIGGGIICLIGSLSATSYYFSMKVHLSQETYPISKRWDFKRSNGQISSFRLFEGFPSSIFHYFKSKFEVTVSYCLKLYLDCKSFK